MPDDLLCDPDWFLDRIDPATGQANFVKTDVDRLSAAVFLDGRVPFSSGPARGVAIERLSSPDSGARLRLILHMSFCGSSQLAQLVGASGAAVVLKEPQVLVDLADWHRAMVEQGVADARFEPALAAATGLLARGWPGHGPVVIKPSNWVNNLIPLFARNERPTSIVLVTIDERAFLRAVFRGGRERIAFTARAASHFAAATGHSARVAEAIAGVADPLDQVARLVLLAHAIQRCWFDALLESRPDVASIDFVQVRDDPLAALGTVLAALGLVSLPDRLSAAVENRAAVDAKQPDRRFSRTAQAEDDDSVERHHGDRFDRALGWASAKKF